MTQKIGIAPPRVPVYSAHDSTFGPMVCHHDSAMKLACLILSIGLIHAQALGQTVSYRKQVAPILAASCNACHGGAQPQSGLILTSHAAILKGGRRGKAVA